MQRQKEAAAIAALAQQGAGLAQQVQGLPGRTELAVRRKEAVRMRQHQRKFALPRRSGPRGGGNPGGVGGNTVPEPGSWALAATALVVVLCLQRRRPGIRQAAQRLWRRAGERRLGGRGDSAELGLGQGLMVMGVGR